MSAEAGKIFGGICASLVSMHGLCKVRNRGSRDGTVHGTVPVGFSTNFPKFFVGPLNHPCRGRDNVYQRQTRTGLLLDDNNLFRWATNNFRPSCIGVADDQATACAFRFLRQPSRPNAPRPVAKSGRAAGMGVTTSP
jgi:hypothetical protein